MAPKRQTAVKNAASKPKGQAHAKAQASADKKKLQSNLAGQAKNAADRLKKNDEGVVALTPEEVDACKLKVEFWKNYKNMSKNSEGKNEMLEQFSMDKTCQRWTQRTSVVSQLCLEKNSPCRATYLKRMFSVLSCVVLILLLQVVDFSPHCNCSNILVAQRNLFASRFRSGEGREPRHQGSPRQEAFGHHLGQASQ